MSTIFEQIKSPLSIYIGDKINQLEQNGEKIAKVHNGEPYISTPEYIKIAAINEISNNNLNYCNSQGLIELRKAIADYHMNNSGAVFTPEDILISAGAVNSIFIALNSLLEIGDEVIIIDPAWPQYENISIIHGAQVSHISTKSTNGRLTKKLLKATISDKTKLVIINNPCNPTGIVYERKEITNFIELLKENKNLYFLFDEVYDFYDYSNKFSSVLENDQFDNFRSRIIYVNSFSKTFAMTGWRVGYCIAPKAIIMKMLIISQNMITCVAPFTQIAALKALVEKDNYKHEYDTYIHGLRKRKNTIKKILNKRKINYIDPQGAFYFFIDSQKDSTKIAKQSLELNQIAMVPGISYGKDFNSHLRLSYATDNYSFSKLLEWLKVVDFNQ